MKKLIWIIIITIILFPFQTALADPYPPPEPTPTPNNEVLPPGILNNLPWCTTLPAENNLCAYGFDTGSPAPRWYLIKDGPIDPHPSGYNYCIVWTNTYGNHLDTCLELELHSYHPGYGINGSGRNIYVSDWWLVCGGGYINFDVWMTNIRGEIIYADIKEPNYYMLYCRFLPHTSRMY